MSVDIIQGEARAVLEGLPAASVHCIITSPPYYSLRDYDCAGQIGLEPTPQAYAAALVQVFAAAWRVLRDDGTFWCVLGDSYANTGGHTAQGASSQRAGRANVAGQNAVKGMVPAGCKPKNLLGMPWRVAFALQDAGWILRQDIVWSKPSCMPESVGDRCTRSHEYIFMFAKQERYYYDADAIRSPLRPKTLTTFGTTRHSKGTDALSQVKAHNWSRDVPERQPRLDADGNHAGANKRSVWTVASEPLDEPHFAAFPQKLVEPMILAGTSEAGCCPRCAVPWRRVVERGDLAGEARIHKTQRPAARERGVSDSSLLRSNGRTWRETHDRGWQAGCSCDAGPPLPCTTLDPFLGSGTTALVSKRLGRCCVGIDLNPAYCALAQRRVESTPYTLFSAASTSTGAAR